MMVPPPTADGGQVCGLLDLDGRTDRGKLMAIDGSGRWDHCVAHVPGQLLRQFRLRPGQEVAGRASALGAHSDPQPRLVEVATVDGLPWRQRLEKISLSRATATAPRRHLRTETDGKNLATRMVDMFAPIGFGQRGLIVAPPRAGKTTLLRALAEGILANAAHCHLMALLVDERPEEVTDFFRNVPAELFASSNDEPIDHHLRVVQLAFQRAENLVESGRDVVMLLDSITRLARAYNCATASGGRTMSGGLDARAMEKPRQLFSMARETEEIGSLTVLATALVDTGSRMDELIFQEFKGTGNWELVLDKKLAEQRIFPAINLQATGTRREELLISPAATAVARQMQRAMAGQRPDVAMETLLARLGKTADNAEFIALIQGRS